MYEHVVVGDLEYEQHFHTSARLAQLLGDLIIDEAMDVRRTIQGSR